VGGEVLLVAGVEIGDEGVEEEELAFENLHVLLEGGGLGDVGWWAVVDAGVTDEGSEAEDGVAGGLGLGGVEAVLGLIDAGVLLRVGVVHVGERAGGLGGAPADVVEGVEVEVDDQVGVFGVFVVLDDGIEELDVPLEEGLLGVEVGGDSDEAVGVVLNLGVEALLGLVDKVAVVLPLDATLETAMTRPMVMVTR
jgi:hypothetical protein